MTTVSVKLLASLNMPTVCARCWWIEHQIGLPWQRFPGIFSTIAGYTEWAANLMFERHDREWLPEGVVDTIKAPTWRDFHATDPQTGITLRGSPDWIGTYDADHRQWHVVDFKTAIITRGQDELLPLYQAQLNGYAWIAEQRGAKVVSMSIVYAEPNTAQVLVDDEGPTLRLRFVPRPVERIQVPPLLKVAEAILGHNRPPAPQWGPDKESCKECVKLNAIINSIRGEP